MKFLILSSIVRIIESVGLEGDNDFDKITDGHRSTHESKLFLCNIFVSIFKEREVNSLAD